jgi:hypothetical protein
MPLSLARIVQPLQVTSSNSLSMRLHCNQSQVLAQNNANRFRWNSDISNMLGCFVVVLTGMRVAFDVLRCIELLGGAPTGPDYEALVAGVVAENNADVALELSDR